MSHIHAFPCIRLRTLFILRHPFCHILLLHLFNFVMRMPKRPSRRTFLDETFILNAMSSWRTSPTLTYPLSFIVGVGSHCVMSRSHVHPCWSKSFTLTCMDSIIPYLISSLAFEVRALLSHRRLLLMCSVSLGLSFLITLVMIVWRLCLQTSLSLLFVSTLLSGVIVSSLTIRALQKAISFWTWSWILFFTLYLTITLSQSLMLDFCCPFLSVLV